MGLTFVTEHVPEHEPAHEHEQKVLKEEHHYRLERELKRPGRPSFWATVVTMPEVDYELLHLYSPLVPEERRLVKREVIETVVGEG